VASAFGNGSEVSETSVAATWVSFDESQRTDRILEAANECFIRLGIDRTSVRDVAECADVSRGTIYRHFTDRSGLVAAAIEFGAQQFYRRLAEAMSTHATLVKQMGALAEAFAQVLVDHRTRSRLLGDDLELVRHIISGGGTAVDRIAAFLLPYVQDARRRGEVREGIDVEHASEWLARIVFSLAAVGPARSFDLDVPHTVRKHMEEFGISGLR